MVRFLYIPLDSLTVTRKAIARAVAQSGAGTLDDVARDLRIILGSADRCASEKSLVADCFTSQACAYRSGDPVMPHEAAIDMAFVAMKSGRSVGLVCTSLKQASHEPFHVFVSSLCVAAEERGSGVGRDLLAMVGKVFPGVPARLTVARRGAKGGDRRAQEELRRRFPRLVSLYKSAGFREVGIVPLGSGDAVEMLASDGVLLVPPRLRVLSRRGTVQEWHDLRNFLMMALLAKHAPFRAFREDLARRRQGRPTRGTPYPTKLVAYVDRVVKAHLAHLQLPHP